MSDAVTLQGFRPVEPIVEAKGKPLKRALVAPPPKIAWLPLSQLVIDEGYQRGLSNKSLMLIRRLVASWDWNCFKPLSVAPCDAGGHYEIVDGQHVAIAAATHGSIELLPCLVLDAETRAKRSAAFVGINADRIPLTPFALYRGRLMSGDANAVAIDAALQASGCDLLESLRYQDDYPAGTLACVSSLALIVRQHGQEILTQALQLARAASWTPIPSAGLKALAQILAGQMASPQELAPVLETRSGDDLVDEATSLRRSGAVKDLNSGCVQILLQALSRKIAA